MTTLAQLHNYENNVTVREILNQFFCTDNDADLMNAIETEDNDIVWSWCEDSKMNKTDLIDWIDASLDDKNCFKVLNDEGHAGGYPEVQIDLKGGVVLNIDWGDRGLTNK